MFPERFALEMVRKVKTRRAEKERERRQKWVKQKRGKGNTNALTRKLRHNGYLPLHLVRCNVLSIGSPASRKSFHLEQWCFHIGKCVSDQPQPLIRTDELEVALDSTVTLRGILHARTFASLARIALASQEINLSDITFEFSHKKGRIIIHFCTKVR